ncbi:hypothetical protein LSS_15516 [Leptospira santarosai serovar Shermani str. LT 821]|uniref:Uncharacterized protein n=1 Tax=Leptospira santarosai serovar Shermani str. LT 821 TaxID=758847 RepID=K8XWS0_9LEPT|nr:hypothetical protein LSS_15516 [Leptospira santarosai serovar Shermani str. LT 821]
MIEIVRVPTKVLIENEKASGFSLNLEIKKGEKIC